MASASRTYEAGNTKPDLVNWDLQKKKLWRGKGHAPTHNEIRAVAEAGVVEGLKTRSPSELISLVAASYRHISLKAARDKRDKALQLKREYFSAVSEILEEALRKQVERANLAQEEEEDLDAEINTVTRGIEKLHLNPEIKELKEARSSDAPKPPRRAQPEKEAKGKPSSLREQNEQIPRDACLYAHLHMRLTQAVQALPDSDDETSLHGPVELDGREINDWVEIEADADLDSGWVNVEVSSGSYY